MTIDLTRRFARNVRRLRDEMGLSAKDLSDRVEALGVPMGRSVLAYMETGRRDTVDLAEAYAIARVLGTTVDYLAEMGTVRCVQCADAPPEGYRCMLCNRVGEVALPVGGAL